MTFLIYAAIAAGLYALYERQKAPSIGPQGTYIDELGGVWDLSTEYAASAGDGSSSILWVARQPKPPIYCYVSGLCPNPQAATKADLAKQIDTIAAAFKQVK